MSEGAEEGMELVFNAAADAIAEWSQEIITNYAEVNNMPWEETTAAVGKALVLNGVAAMAQSVTSMTALEIAELVNDVTALIAGRLESWVEEKHSCTG